MENICPSAYENEDCDWVPTGGKVREPQRVQRTKLAITADKWKNRWITTEQMLNDLKKDADNEQEYTHHIGGILRSTHWLIYDSKKKQFSHSTNWTDYDWYTEAEFLDDYEGHWWMRDA